MIFLSNTKKNAKSSSIFVLKMNKNNLAQKIIVNLYLRYRFNRTLKKKYPMDMNTKSAQTMLHEHYSILENESWNALQTSKRIYYGYKD